MTKGLTVTIDTKEFDRVFKEYMEYSKRSFAEACNQHAYYIARNATMTTKAANKDDIQKDLEATSKSHPPAPLAAILINAQLGKQGKGGLSGASMASAVTKYIKTAKSHVNFVRAGWIPAIKKLSAVVPKKSGGRIPSGTDKPGRTFGDAIPAKTSFSPIAWIWNSVHGSIAHGNKSEKVKKILEEGINKAIAKESESMKKYIEKKQMEEIKKLWG